MPIYTFACSGVSAHRADSPKAVAYRADRRDSPANIQKKREQRRALYI